MEEQHLQAYLRLIFHNGVSESWLGTLLSRFGGLQEVVNTANSSNLPGRNAAEPARLEALTTAYSSDSAVSNREIELIQRWREDPGNTLLCFDSPDYPMLLKQIPCPPPLLFLRGDPGLLASACCAMVGSRKASSYGMRNAKWLARELAASGFTIVSGLAAGIDSGAHQGALDGSGATIAVMGCGVDRVYPKHNKMLMEEIAQRGAVLSEYPLTASPRPHHFPRRNRIISGLSLGIIVVEAATRSGSLITARLAMEQGREVFAVPGPISSIHSSGCHRLIADGATLIENPETVTAALLDGWRLDKSTEYRETDDREIVRDRTTRPAMATKGDINSNEGKSRPINADPNGEAVLNAITEPGCLLDNVARRTKLSLAEVNSAILELEMTGLVTIEGGRVTRC